MSEQIYQVLPGSREWQLEQQNEYMPQTTTVQLHTYIIYKNLVMAMCR